MSRSIVDKLIAMLSTDLYVIVGGRRWMSDGRRWMSDGRRWMSDERRWINSASRSSEAMNTSWLSGMNLCLRMYSLGSSTSTCRGSRGTHCPAGDLPQRVMKIMCASLFFRGMN